MPASACVRIAIMSALSNWTSLKSYLARRISSNNLDAPCGVTTNPRQPYVRLASARRVAQARVPSKRGAAVADRSARRAQHAGVEHVEIGRQKRDELGGVPSPPLARRGIVLQYEVRSVLARDALPRAHVGEREPGVYPGLRSGASTRSPRSMARA